MNEDKLQKPKITPIEEAYYEWGLYFWQLPDGHLFHDGSGNFLTVQAEHKADLNAVKKITDAAKYYGKEGKPQLQSILIFEVAATYLPKASAAFPGGVDR